MKTYTTIPIEVNKLNIPDIYRFTCLSFTKDTRKEYTDSTFEQIKELTKDNSTETVKNFVDRLRKSELITIDTDKTTKTTIDGVVKIISRNHYNIPNYQVNFRMIHSSFLEVDLSIYEKGFLIGMFTLCLNNTKNCQLKQKDIAEKLNIGKSTVSEYLKSLTSKGYIEKFEKGFLLNVKEFLISRFTNKQKEKLQELYLLPKFRDIIKRTNWETVRNIDNYILSIESGTININKPIKEQFEYIC